MPKLRLYFKLQMVNNARDNYASVNPQAPVGGSDPS